MVLVLNANFSNRITLIMKEFLQVENCRLLSSWKKSIGSFCMKKFFTCLYTLTWFQGFFQGKNTQVALSRCLRPWYENTVEVFEEIFLGKQFNHLRRNSFYRMIIQILDSSIFLEDPFFAIFLEFGASLVDSFMCKEWIVSWN